MHDNSSDEFSTMTRKDVCAALQIGPATLDRIITSGQLPVYKLGPRLVRFLRSDVEALLTPA